MVPLTPVCCVCVWSLLCLLSTLCSNTQNTSLKEITATINGTGVTRVKLAEDDIRLVINTLVADCRWGCVDGVDGWVCGCGCVSDMHRVGWQRAGRKAGRKADWDVTSHATHVTLLPGYGFIPYPVAFPLYTTGSLSGQLLAIALSCLSTH
jgi:hypothetical protein